MREGVWMMLTENATLNLISGLLGAIAAAALLAANGMI
jgi:hypothetical protein